MQSEIKFVWSVLDIFHNLQLACLFTSWHMCLMKSPAALATSFYFLALAPCSHCTCNNQKDYFDLELYRALFLLETFNLNGHQRSEYN